MIDTKTLPALPTQSTHSAASDAHADVQAAIDILRSLCLAGKLSQGDYDSVRYFLHSAQGWMTQPSPTIVCLCGSTRFSNAFHTANLQETLAGNIVLSIGCDFKSDSDLLLAGELTPADKERLDELHLRKIDLADEVFILNVGGYVGESTRREIAYAQEHGKRLRWLEYI